MGQADHLRAQMDTAAATSTLPADVDREVVDRLALDLMMSLRSSS